MLDLLFDTYQHATVWFWTMHQAGWFNLPERQQINEFMEAALMDAALRNPKG